MATISAARDVTSTHPFTCSACQVAFRNPEVQKTHMKSDWHRYNLNRRVSDLPPLSSEVFSERVLKAREEKSAEQDKAGFKQSCDACDRIYYSENSYQNHLSSAKHKKRTKELARHGKGDDASSILSSTFSLGDPMDKASVDSDVEGEFAQVVEGLKNADLHDSSSDRPSPVKRPSNPHLSAAGQHKAAHPVSDPSSNQASSTTTPVPTASTKTETREVTLKTCLFCTYDSPTLELNVAHMERFHSMFVPEKEFLVDLEGLVGFLQQQVFEKHQCISCGKIKANVSAVQCHMADAGHCKIPYHSEREQLQVGEYYDFRATYSDGEEEDEDGDEKTQDSAARVKRGTVMVNEKGEELVDEGDGWETDSSASSIDTDEITSLPKDQHFHQYEKLDKHLHHAAHSDPRKHKSADGFHSHAHKSARHAAFYDEYELHLPTGKSLGHRSLARFYKQNLRDRPLAQERAEMQLLENGDAMDVDGEERKFGKNHSRDLVTRANGGQGMVGVADHKKREAMKGELKDKEGAERHGRRLQALLGKRSNNQKNYYYREG